MFSHFWRITHLNVLSASKKGNGVLLHKAKQPKRAPVGSLSKRKKVPEYYLQSNMGYRVQEEEEKTEPGTAKAQATDKGPVFTKRKSPKQEEDEATDSQEIGNFCFGYGGSQSENTKKPGTKKIRPLHEKDLEGINVPQKLHDEVSRTMFTKQHDPRSMEEIQEEEAQLEFAKRVSA